MAEVVGDLLIDVISDLIPDVSGALISASQQAPQDLRQWRAWNMTGFGTGAGPQSAFNIKTNFTSTWCCVSNAPQPPSYNWSENAPDNTSSW